MENQNTNEQKNLMISVAIIIAGILIAGSVIYSKGSNQPQDKKAPDVAQQQESTDAVRPISEEDHIKGNPNAQVVIVEYSDFECPFCKRFHDTMNQVMDEYGPTGKVAWVYRHFPLDQLHSKARPEAIASECASELGGEGAFWKFADRFYELTPSNDQTEASVITKIIKEIGIDAIAFTECLNSGKYDQRVEADVANAVETGGRGTPWSIVITSSGQTLPLSGAQSYESVKQLIEIALSEE